MIKSINPDNQEHVSHRDEESRTPGDIKLKQIVWKEDAMEIYQI